MADPDLVDAERFHAHRDRLASASHHGAENKEAAPRRDTDRRRTYAPALITPARQPYIDVEERKAGDVDNRPSG